MGQIRDGNRAAFGTLLGRYWSPLVSFAEAFVDTRETAKDVVQDVFIRVWWRRDSWIANGSVRGFLYRITRNVALNARRDRAAEHARRERAGSDQVSAGDVPGPHEMLEASLLREEVEAAIAALPERRRQVFVLARFHQLSHREIAEAMGISTQTVANQMSAAVSELRRALAHHLCSEI